MQAVVQGARAAWRVLWRSKQLEADMREEMRFHLQQEADRLAQVEGLNPEEARRQAFVRFGGVERYKEEGREARGLYWLEGLSLDARLGVRMLIKHRWLTLVGGVAMAVAIAIGATAFEVINNLLDPTLPFPHGARVVAVQYVATKTGAAWRQSSRSSRRSPRLGRRGEVSACRPSTRCAPTARAVLTAM